MGLDRWRAVVDIPLEGFSLRGMEGDGDGDGDDRTVFSLLLFFFRRRLDDDELNDGTPVCVLFRLIVADFVAAVDKWSGLGND